MANIDARLNDLRETFTGKDSRPIIVDILKRINSEGGDASSMNDVPAADWATATELSVAFEALLKSIRKTEKLSNDEATKDHIPMTKAIFEVLGDVEQYPRSS
ncbi:MAG: hypothetical protein J6Y02_01405 [Pseudobutyrivibrio sp.]|nr:hypothetical protein [Pseudobutyrivibrio sp.]